LTHPRKPILRSVISAALLSFAASAAVAQTQAPLSAMTPDGVKSYDSIRPQADFIKRVVMIPMRDGVKLYTVVVMKKGTKNAPILLSRTPYDAKGSTSRTQSQKATEILSVLDEVFIEDNYIRVYQDVRGLHGSEGDFIMNRPLRGPLNSTTTDESTDAYDTIEWLTKNTPESSGKVGVIGSSYLGFTALMAEINPHPALKAAVPQSPMVDGWMGDDWFHYGAFRNTNIAYTVGVTTGKGSGGSDPTGVGDDYSRYLEAGSTGDYIRHWGFDQYPFLQKIMQNAAYTPFWSQQAVDKWFANHDLSVPTLLMVSQWDQEDSYGAPAVYKAIKSRNKDAKVSLLIGPWPHSGGNHYGFKLGDIAFKGDTALEARVNYIKPFLDHHLKGSADPQLPAAMTYATGADKWQHSTQWPAGKPTKLYLREGFGLSFEAPDVKPSTNQAQGHDDYVSDPSKPVPFIPRPINMNDSSQWKPWLVRDQRFVSDRPDVLVYTGPVLDKPLHIMGQPLVELFAATSGSDADWVVKLIDVYPNVSPEGGQGVMTMAGFELPIGIEIYRGRYVRGFDKPQALTPNKIEAYQFGLPHVNHVFLPGHRLMVQIQSSLFPLYDRNPQTYVENIFNAKASDYKKATQSIYRTKAAASNIVLPVVEN